MDAKIEEFFGPFQVLETESQEEFDSLLNGLREENQPSTPAENALVEGLAKHYWLAQRVNTMQTMCLTGPGIADRETEKKFKLLLRCQVRNDRAFSKFLKDVTRSMGSNRRKHVSDF